MVAEMKGLSFDNFFGESFAILSELKKSEVVLRYMDLRLNSGLKIHRMIKPMNDLTKTVSKIDFNQSVDDEGLVKKV